MSYYGTVGTVNGLLFGLAMRGAGNGTYQVVFEREYASLEEIEKIDWKTPDIQGECILPKGYGFQVKAITYNSDQRAYTVHLQVDSQYLGDVTGYQEQVKQLKSSLTETNQALDDANSQLAEADEQIMALYEQMAKEKEGVQG